MLCGMTFCPLIPKASYRLAEEKLKESMFGPTTSIFVGWKEYPNVFVGPLTSMDSENPSLLDNPGLWYGKDFGEIIQMRSLLVRGKQKQSVHDKNQFIEQTQELALSVMPLDTEVSYRRKPVYSMSFSPLTQPMGPSGILEGIKITENPKIPSKVDYVISDEVKSSEAISRLYGSGYDVYYLTRVLSSGVLGATDKRKLVPTRWSITAVDDILCKSLLEDIRGYPAISDYLVYSSTYLDNHFEILLMPGAWEFEQFEAWSPQTLWARGYSEPAIAQDGEGFYGRSEYAFNEGGGYYAGRLGVAEALFRMRCQARVVVFREILEGYVVPVGVWEVRENVRKAMQNPPAKFVSLDEALAYLNSRLSVPINRYLGKSVILHQKRLSDYM